MRRCWPKGIGASLSVTLFLATTGPEGAVAQDSPVFVDADTQVRAVRFTFLDDQSFSVDRLRERIALRSPGSFAFLPFISSGPFPFTPLELQRDVARLRLFYRRSGYPDVDVDYTVSFDAEDNRVEIDFLIREGAPRVRGSLRATDDAGVDVATILPPELRPAWNRFLASVPPLEGARLGSLELAQLEDAASGWLRGRGYPFGTATSELAEDSTGSLRVDVTLRVTTGRRARIGSVAIEGARLLETDVIARELPFGPGDRYSSARLAEGERELFGLDLIRLALADPIPVESSDSLVDVRVRVEEGLPRVISGQVGYATEAGLLGQADWAHRNFAGAGRTLSTSLQGRTGALVFGPDLQRRYSASVSLKQPYFFSRRSSLIVTPSVEYRDDLRDRSVQIGGEAVVLQQWGVLRTASVQVGVSRRRILDYRLTGSEGFDFRNVLVRLDSLERDIRTSTLGATVAWGAVDNPIAPRSGYLVRAGTELTGPGWTSSAQYARLEASVARFLPLNDQTGLIVRLAGGRLFPFGKSIPSTPDQKTESLLRLRDAVFTGGGRYDVRGWGEQQLGPKFPDVRLRETEPDTILVAERYVPLGGLARALVSAELRLPLPGASADHSTHIFLDGGKVWSPDERFGVDGIGEADFRFSLGGGVEFGTPLGLFRLSLGYKLNPSLFDERDPEAVFAAMLAGAPVFAIPRDPRRRWHLHLAIGQIY